MTTENTTQAEAAATAIATGTAATAPALTHTLLRADGLSCPSCVAKIEHALDALPGVDHSHVRFSSGRIEVVHDPAVAPVQQLVQTVADAGYTARPSAL